MFLRIATTMILLHLAAQQAWAQTTDILTLDQAIAIALEDNPSLKNAALEVESAGDQVAAARTRRLPSFNFILWVRSSFLTSTTNSRKAFSEISME